MLAAALLTALSLGAPPPPTDADLKKRADGLVARLGSPGYRDREAAARELLDIGYPARDAVLAGQKSPDSEISDRCTKLYPVIWRADLEKRVRTFLVDPEGLVAADLPGAARWLKAAGDGKESRQLYATLVRAHSEPLTDVELHPARLRQAYLDLARDAHLRTGGRSIVQEADVLLFLFLGAAGDVRPAAQPGISSSYYYQFLNSPYLTAQLGADPPAVPVRKLYAAWLEKERYSIVLRRGIDVAAQHKVHECAPVALQIASDPGTVVTVRAMALLGFARLATKDDAKDLAPFLTNELQLAATNINGERATVQFRDVALGAAVQLAGQNLSDFGFERKPPAGLTSVASYIYYAFTTDEKRTAAHAKWREWAAANLKK
jgi:hypothetical protein